MSAARPAPLALHRARGFTLLEAMVSVAILAVLAALAAPSMSNMIASQRTKSAASDLFTSLTRARSEAIKRNTDVTLSAEGGNWRYGWRIVNPGDADHPIEKHGPVPGLTVVSGVTSLVYGGSGRPRGSAAPTFAVRSADGSAQRCVGVDLSGRPYLKKTACPG